MALVPVKNQTEPPEMSLTFKECDFFLEAQVFEVERGWSPHCIGPFSALILLYVMYVIEIFCI